MWSIDGSVSELHQNNRKAILDRKERQIDLGSEGDFVMHVVNTDDIFTLKESDVYCWTPLASSCRTSRIYTVHSSVRTRRQVFEQWQKFQQYKTLHLCFFRLTTKIIHMATMCCLILCCLEAKSVFNVRLKLTTCAYMACSHRGGVTADTVPRDLAVDVKWWQETCRLRMLFLQWAYVVIHIATVYVWIRYYTFGKLILSRVEKRCSVRSKPEDFLA